MTRKFIARHPWLQSNLLLGAIAIVLLIAIALIANSTGGVAIELGGLQLSLSAQNNGQLELLFAQAV